MTSGARPRPPRPESRPERAGPLTRLKLFRADMFRSQPERLYRAWMARMHSPIGQSVLVNDPQIIREVLEYRPADFPKARGIGHALRPLLGRSVFVTNGAEWEAQRRIIDPAFETGRLKDNFAPMCDAISDAVQRLKAGRVEMEYEMSYLAADVIFRTLFSMPLDAPVAKEVFETFRAFQRAQPLLSPAAFLPFAHWLLPPPGYRFARRLRALLADMVVERQAAIEAGTAPPDLATKIMTTPDPQTGRMFSRQEMVDQVAIFFLAGHETSASALSWALYCLALDPKAQNEVAQEAAALAGDPTFKDLSALPFTRDVFREALRLYPPVPMMVRETAQPEHFRDTDLKQGSLVILSPWHLHRHERIWSDPDLFDPWRWQKDDARQNARRGYLPFSKGQRVCSGAGFAMMEGTLALAMLMRSFSVTPSDPEPVPVAHLTVRSENGIFLNLAHR